MSKETGGSMYPGRVFSHFRSNADCNGSEAVYMDSQGLTIRDFFAGQALNDSHANGWGKPEDQAKRAYAIADAMLAERSKP
jgi:hypothetical protein